MATANEMRDEFNIEYDRVTSQAAKGFLDDEIAFFLNLAQSDIRRQWLNLPDTAERQSYLFPLKRNEILTEYSDQTLTTRDDSILYNVPSDYPGRSEKEVVTYRNCDTPSIVTPITDDEYFVMELDVAKAPTHEELRRLLTNPPGTSDIVFELFLPKDSNLAVNKYLVTYIKEPRKIVIDFDDPDNQVNSEYAEDKHIEIVRRAVFYALETSADGRLKTYPSKPMNFGGLRTSN